MARHHKRGRGTFKRDFVVLRFTERRGALEVVDLSTALSENNVPDAMRFEVNFTRMDWTFQHGQISDTQPIGKGSTRWQSQDSFPLAVLGVFNRNSAPDLDRMVEHALRMAAPSA